jgi:ankyrin repeat protein
VLHSVALQGNLAAVELLVSRRASIDPVDLAGLTPLHLAVREGHLSVATKLLEHGANPGVRAGNGMTVLDFAGNDRDMDAARASICETLTAIGQTIAAHEAGGVRRL